MSESDRRAAGLNKGEDELAKRNSEPPPDPRAQKLMQMMGGALSPEEMQIILLLRATGMGAGLREILSPTIEP